VGSSNATRRKVGEYPTMTLAQARTEALLWRAAITEGKDPTVERSRERRRRQHMFKGV